MSPRIAGYQIGHHAEAERRASSGHALDEGDFTEGHELPGKWSAEGNGGTPIVAGRSEEVVGEVGIRAVATKSSLEQRSI
jgi:hypothetical protein